MRDEGKNDKEKIVTLTYPIEVQSTPVTQKQWVEIMGENPSHFAKGEEHSAILTFHGKDIELQPDHPVENVTWWSTLVFANRLSEKQGFPPIYDLSDIDWEPNTRAENGTLRPAEDKKDQSNKIRIQIKGKNYAPYQGNLYYQAEGYRLPTSAEQVYLLQGGGKMKDKDFEKNHDDLKDRAWYYKNSGDRTHPVELLQSIVIDGKDFYDLYGNVYEWGWDNVDWDLKIAKDPVDLMDMQYVHPNPKLRRASGGGWTYSNWTSASYAYARFSHNRASNTLGFRLVRTIEPSDGKQNSGE